MSIIRLEDRVLFEAAAAIEAADTANQLENLNAEQNADDSEGDFSQTEVPVQNVADASNNSTPGADGVDAYAKSLVEGDMTSDDSESSNAIADFIASEMENDSEQVNFIEILPVNDDANAIGRELVIINSSVHDADDIIASISEKADVLQLTSGSDALSQINDFLDSKGIKYDTIHIVSHGNAGFFSLNGEVFDSENVSERAEDFAAIGEHITDEGDIMLYGCNLAANDTGKALVAQIADITGADVAASIDDTGVSGNWELEYTFGNVTSASIEVENYGHNLTSYYVTLTTDTNYYVDIDAGLDGTGVGNSDGVSGDLRWAVNQANSHAGMDEIILKTSVTLKSSITIADSVTIDANGFNAIYPNASSRIFTIIGNAGDSPDALVVNFEGVRLGNNSGTPHAFDGQGGGVYIENATLNWNAAQAIRLNALEGGVIYAKDAIVNIQEQMIPSDGNFTNAFNNNKAVNGGSIIWAVDSQITLNSVSIFAYGATGTTVRGGAFHIEGGSLAMGDVTLIGSNISFTTRTDAYGMFLYAENADIIFERVSLTCASDNVSFVKGGMIYAENSNIDISYSNFTFTRQAASEGNAIYLAGNGNTLSVTNSVMNRGLHLNSMNVIEGGSALFSNTVLYASVGSGVNSPLIEVRGGVVDIVDSTISGAGNTHAGVYATGGTVNILNSVLTHYGHVGGDSVFAEDTATLNMKYSVYYNGSGTQTAIDSTNTFYGGGASQYQAINNDVFGQNNSNILVLGTDASSWVGRYISLNADASNPVIQAAGFQTATIMLSGVRKSVYTLDNGRTWNTLDGVKYANAEAKTLSLELNNFDIRGYYREGGAAFRYSAGAYQLGAALAIGTDSITGAISYFTTIDELSGGFAQGGQIILGKSLYALPATVEIGSNLVVTGHKSIDSRSYLSLIAPGTFDGTSTYRPFTIKSGVEAAFTNVQFIGGNLTGLADDAGNGGVFYVQAGGSLALDNVAVKFTVSGMKSYYNTSNPSAAVKGGVVYFESGASVMISNSSFRESSFVSKITNTTNFGGIVYADGNSTDKTSVTFENVYSYMNNTYGTTNDSAGDKVVTGRGGLVYANYADVIMKDVVIIGDNQTTNTTGIAYIVGGTFTVENLTTTTIRNGAIGLVDTIANINNMSIRIFSERNCASAAAVYASNTDLTITDSEFKLYESSINWAFVGFSVYDGKFTMNNVRFENSRNKIGSATGSVIDWKNVTYDRNLYNSTNTLAGVTGTIDGLIVTNNSQGTANLFAITNASTLEMKNMRFVDNSTKVVNADPGSLISIVNANVTISHSIFDNNLTLGYASGADVNTADPTRGGSIIKNSTTTAAYKFVVTDSIFKNNTGWSSGVMITTSYSFIYNSAFIDNTALSTATDDTTAGAIWFDNNQTVYVENSTFVGNSASRGAAINGRRGESSLYLVNSTVTGNYCFDSSSGSAVRAANTIFIINSIVQGNAALKDVAANYIGVAYSVYDATKVTVNKDFGGNITSLSVSDIFGTDTPTSTLLKDNGGFVPTIAVTNPALTRDAILIAGGTRNSSIVRNPPSGPTADGNVAFAAFSDDGGATWYTYVVAEAYKASTITGGTVWYRTSNNSYMFVQDYSADLTMINTDSRGYLRQAVDGSATQYLTVGSYQKDGASAWIEKDGTETYYTTVAKAVAAAESGDTVYVVDAMSIESASINLNKSVTISGTGEYSGIKAPVSYLDYLADNTLTATNIRTFIANTGNIDVTIEGLIINGGASTNSGGILWSEGSISDLKLTFKDSVIDGGSAQNGNFYLNYYGASNYNVELIFEGVVISNMAGTGGSNIIRFNGNTFSMKDTIFTDDNNKVQGEIIRVNNGNTDITLDNVKAYGHSAGARGTFLSTGEVAGDGSLIIRNSYFSNFTTTDSNGGGVIYFFKTNADTLSTVTIENSVFENNTSQGRGGALRIKAASLDIVKSTFTNNLSKGGDGGAVSYEGAGMLTVDGSTFVGNSSGAFAGGGAIYSYDSNSDVTVMNSSFEANYAKGGGASVYTNGSRLSVYDSTFTNDVATGSGGSIRMSGTGDTYGYAELDNVTVTGATAGQGGAVSLYAYEFSITNSTFIDNLATFNGGGALYIEYGQLTTGEYLIANSTFSSNRSERTGDHAVGGAIYLHHGSLTIRDSVFTDNSVVALTAGKNASGGVIYMYYEYGANNQITIENSTVTGNSAYNAVSGGVSRGGVYGHNSSKGLNVIGGYYAENYAQEGGVFYTSKPLSVSGATFEGNAADKGGVFAITNTTLSIVNSVFAYNIASEGGVIQAWNMTDILTESSTFYANSAAKGSVYNATSGGSWNWTIVNSTFVDNIAGSDSGLIVNGWTNIYLMNSLFMGNGITVYDNNIWKSIYSYYSIFDSDKISYRNAPTKSVGNTLEAQYSDVFADGTPVLKDNGGNVKTIAVLPNNTAYQIVMGYHTDASNKNYGAYSEDRGVTFLRADGIAVTTEVLTAINKDARGEYRFQPTDVAVWGYTAGAYQVDAPALWVGSGDINDPGNIFYREVTAAVSAIINAQTGGLDDIWLLNRTYTLASQLTISADMSFNAYEEGATLSVINPGASTYRIMELTNGATVIINGLTLIGGKITANDANKGGGAIFASATSNANLTLNNVGIYDASVINGTGGAIHFQGGALVIKDSSIIGNNQTGWGATGGVYANGTSLEVTDSFFTSNTAAVGNGGALNVGSRNTSITLDGISFYTNSAAATGGALYVTGSATITNSYFFDNSAASAGALYFTGTSYIDECSFVSNSASGNGGVIVNQNGQTINITNSVFEGNTAANGGAIYVGGSSGVRLNIANSVFDGNSATKYGGAIATGRMATIAIYNATFFANEAVDGGGALALTEFATTQIGNTTFANNTANGVGDAILVYHNGVGNPNATTITNSIIVGNGTNDITNNTTANVTLKYSLAGTTSGTGSVNVDATSLSGVTVNDVYGTDQIELLDNGGLMKTVAVNPFYAPLFRPDNFVLGVRTNANGSWDILVSTTGGTEWASNAAIKVIDKDGRGFDRIDEAGNYTAGAYQVNGVVGWKGDVTDKHAAGNEYYFHESELGNALSTESGRYGIISGKVIFDGSIVIMDDVYVRGRDEGTFLEIARWMPLFIVNGGNFVIETANIKGGFAIYSGSALLNEISINDADTAIDMTDGNLTLVNTTISGNGTAIYADAGTINIISTTIAGNDNGILVMGSAILNIAGSIVVDNGAMDIASAATVNAKYNVIGNSDLTFDATNKTSATVMETFGNENYKLALNGTKKAVLTIRVDDIYAKYTTAGALTGYSTDASEIFYSADGSAWFNMAGTTVAAPSNIVERDATGSIRMYGENAITGVTGYAAGAFSGVTEIKSLTVTIAEDIFDPYDGYISLREAIYYASLGVTSKVVGHEGESYINFAVTDAKAGGDLISVKLASQGAELYTIATEHDYEIDGATTVTASERITITCDSGKYIFNFQNGNVTVSNVDFVSGGKISGNANPGIINVAGSSVVTFKNATFTGALTDYQGGAIQLNSANAKVVVVNSEFFANSASGIVVNNGRLEVSGTTFRDNVANGWGGIAMFGGSGTITDSVFNGNKASAWNGNGDGVGWTATNGSGAAIIVGNASLEINNSVFTNNTNTNRGTIHINSASANVKITNSYFGGNTAGGANSANSGFGGAISLANGTLNVINSTFVNNTVTSTQAAQELQGGAIYVSGGTLNLINVTMAGNSAKNGGDAIRITGGVINAINSLITGNGSNDVLVNGGTFNAAYSIFGNVTGSIAGNGILTGITFKQATGYDDVAAAFDTANNVIRVTNTSVALQNGVLAGLSERGEYVYSKDNGSTWFDISGNEITETVTTKFDRDQRGNLRGSIQAAGAYDAGITVDPFDSLDYRSVNGVHNWNDSGAFEFESGGAWIKAFGYRVINPDAARANSITILSTSTMDITEDITLDQLINNGSINVSANKTLTIANGAGDDFVNNAELDIIGTLILNTGAVWTNATGSRVTYSGADQNIVNVSYDNLVLSGSGVKTAANALTVAGNLISSVTLKLQSNGNSWSDQTVGGTVIYSGTAKDIVASTYTYLTIETASAVSASALKVSVALTVASDSTLELKADGNSWLAVNSVLDGSTIIYSGTTQVVVDDAYYNLEIRSSGVKTAQIAFSVSNNLTLGSGATLVLEFVTSGNEWDGAKSVLASDSTVVYNSLSIQTIIADEYAALTLSGSGVRTASDAFSVSDVLTVESNAALKLMFATLGNEWDGTKSVLSGSVEYAGTVLQTVVIDSYATLALSGEGSTKNFVAGTYSSTNPVAVSDSITVLGAGKSLSVLNGVFSGSSGALDVSDMTFTGATLSDMTFGLSNVIVNDKLEIENTAFTIGNSKLASAIISGTSEGSVYQTLVSGGGITLSDSAYMVMVNSTLAGNTTAALTLNDTARAVLSGVTVTLNASGIVSEAGTTFDVVSSIIAENTADDLALSGSSTFYRSIISDGTTGEDAYGNYHYVSGGTISIFDGAGLNADGTVHLAANSIAPLIGISVSYESGSLVFGDSSIIIGAGLELGDMTLDQLGSERGTFVCAGAYDLGVSFSITNEYSSRTDGANWVDSGAFFVKTSTGEWIPAVGSYLNPQGDVIVTIAVGHTINVVDFTVTDLTVNGVLVISGDAVVNGAFTASSGTVKYVSLSNQAVLGGSYGNIELSGGGVKTASDAISVSGTITNSVTLELKGAANTWTAQSIAGTVIYSGVTAQNIVAGTYENLTFTNSQKTVNGNLFVTDALDAGETNALFGDNVITIGGTFVNYANSNASLASFIYNGVAAQTVAALAYGNLTLTSSAKTANGRFSVAEDFTIEADASLDIAFASDGNEWDGTKSTIFGSVSYSTGAQTIVADSYTALSLSGGIKTASDRFTVSGTLTLNADSTLNIMFASQGDEWNKANSTLAGKVVYGANVSQYVLADDYADLSFEGIGLKTVVNAFSASGIVTVDAASQLTITFNTTGNEFDGSRAVLSGAVEYAGADQVIVTASYGALKFSKDNSIKRIDGVATTTSSTIVIVDDVSVQSLFGSAILGIASGDLFNVLDTGSLSIKEMHLFGNINVDGSSLNVNSSIIDGITASGASSVHITNSRSNGTIYLVGTSDATIVQSTIAGINGAAISLSDNSMLVIANSTIGNNTAAIQMADSATAVIVNSTIARNGTGIAASGTNNIYLLNSIVTHNFVSDITDGVVTAKGSIYRVEGDTAGEDADGNYHYDYTLAPSLFDENAVNADGTIHLAADSIAWQFGRAVSYDAISGMLSYNEGGTDYDFVNIGTGRDVGTLEKDQLDNTRGVNVSSGAYDVSNSFTVTSNYRSAITEGDWNGIGTFEIQLSDGTWSLAVASHLLNPQGSVSVTIRSGHKVNAVDVDVDTLSVIGTLNITGSLLADTFTASNGSTVIYSGTSDQTILDAEYGNLVLKSDGVKTSNGAVTVNNNLTNESVYNALGNLKIVGDTDNTGTIVASLDFTSQGTIINSGILEIVKTASWNKQIIGGEVIYSGTDSQNIVDSTYNDLTLSGGAKSAANDLYVTGALTNSAYLTAIGGLYSSGTLENTGTVELRDSVNTIAQAVLGSTFIYSGVSAQTILGKTYDNLVLSGGSKTLEADMTVKLSIDAGDVAVDFADYTVTLSGTFVNYTNVDASKATVIFNGAAVQQIASLEYGSLTLLNSDKILDHDLTVNNAFDAGNVNVDFKAYTITLGGTFVNYTNVDAATATVIYNGASAQNIASLAYGSLIFENSAKTLDGDIAVAVAFDAGDVNVDFEDYTITLGGTFVNYANVDASSATVIYNGVSAQNIASLAYGTLIFANSTKTLDGDITVNTAFDAGDVVVDFEDYTITLGGTFVNYANVDASNSIVIYNGTAEQQIASLAYGSLIFENSTKTLDGDITVAVAFDAGDVAVDFVDYTVTLSGTFVNYANVDAAAATVIYNGSSAQNIASLAYGSLIFENSAKTLDGDIAVAVAFDAGDVVVDFADYTVTLSGTFVNYTNVDASKATVIFNGAAANIRAIIAQNVASLEYGKLIFEGSEKVLDGDIIVNNLFDGGNVTVNFENYTIALNGGFINYSNVDASSATVKYTGREKQSVASLEYGSLLLENSAKSLDGDITVNEVFDGGNAVIYFADNTITLNGSFVNYANAAASEATFIYSGTTAPQNIASLAYGSLILSGASKTLDGDMIVKGLFNANDTVVDFASKSVTLEGMFAGYANVDASKASVIYAGADQNVAALEYGSIVLEGSGTKSFDEGVVRVNDSFSASGNSGKELIVLENGILDIAGTHDFEYTQIRNMTSLELITVNSKNISGGGNTNIMIILDLPGDVKLVGSDITYGQTLSESSIDNFTITLVDGTLITVYSKFVNGIYMPSVAESGAPFEVEFDINSDPAYSFGLNVTGSLTVNKRSISVKGDDLTIGTSTKEYELTWSIVEGSLVNDDSIEGDLATDWDGKKAGLFLITQGTLGIGTNGENYDFNYIDGVLTVNLDYSGQNHYQDAANRESMFTTQQEKLSRITLAKIEAALPEATQPKDNPVTDGEVFIDADDITLNDVTLKGTADSIPAIEHILNKINQAKDMFDEAFEDLLEFAKQ